MDWGIYISLASLLVSAVALLGVYFSWRAIVANRGWNAILSAASFINAARFDELSDRVDEELEKIEIPLDFPISTDDAQKIFDARSAKLAVTRLLTYMERVATVVNAGGLDDELAYQFAFGEVAGVHTRFEEFIKAKRLRNGDREIMRELETLSERWKKQKETRIAMPTKAKVKRRSGL